MTTIACDGRSIAGDGLITGNGIVHSNSYRKVHRLKSGGVVGFTGGVYHCADALAFLNSGSGAIDCGDEFEAIILHPDGVCECMDGKGRRYRQPVPCVTGSGSAIALGALLAGKSAYDAVKIASEIDTATGGEITMESINE